MRILIIGAGPIGGIIGGRLARAGRDVTLVDIDQAHVQAIRQHGLQVEVPDGPFTVAVPTVLPSEIAGRYDIVCIAVRSPFTRDALACARPHMAEGAILVSLQNGLNAPILEEEAGQERALAGVIRMTSYRPSPGLVTTQLRGKVYLGHLSGRSTSALTRVHALLDSVIPTEMTDNVLGVIWSKLTYSSLGYFWGLADQPIAVIAESQRVRRLCVDFFGELIAVGRAVGVQFIELKEYNPPDYHPQRPFAERLASLELMLHGPGSGMRPPVVSMLQRYGKTEIDWTVGHVIAEGGRLGIATPQCDKLADIIHELEQGKRRLGMHNYDDLPDPSG